MTLTAFLEKIHDAIRDPVCLLCGELDRGDTPWELPACPGCLPTLGLRPEASPVLQNTDGLIHAATGMNPTLKPFLYGYKFYRNKSYLPLLVGLLSTYWRQVQAMGDSETSVSKRLDMASVWVVSIPSRFGAPSDHVGALARQFARRMGFQYQPQALTWHPDAMPQHTLPHRAARFKNVHGRLAVHDRFQTFLSKPGSDAGPDPTLSYLALNPTGDPPTMIVVLDDLTTTGATLLEAQRTLKTVFSVPLAGLAVTHVPLAYYQPNDPSSNPYNNPYSAQPAVPGEEI